MRGCSLVMRRSGVQIPEAAPRKVAALQRLSAFDVVRKPVGLDRFVSPSPVTLVVASFWGSWLPGLA